VRSAVEYQGNILKSNMPFDLVYEFYNNQEGLAIAVNPHVYNAQDICLFNVGTEMNRLNRGYHKAVFHIPGGIFCAGTYRVDNMFCSGSDCYYLHKNAHYFEVENGRDDYFGHYVGVYYPTMITNDYLHY
jgi:hypothetical protein